MMLRHHCLRWLGLVASGALFIYVVVRANPEVILGKIRLLGWSFFLLILLSGIRNVWRTIAWSYCVPAGARHPGVLHLFALRLVSEALNDSMPLGPVLGETARVLGISRIISARAGASSVVIEDLVYGFAALTFMLSGIALGLFSLTTPPAFLWMAASLLMGLLATALTAHWITRRWVSLLDGALDALKRVGVRWGFLARHQTQVRAVEKDIGDFFVARRGLLAFVFAVEFATNFTGIAEAYLILKITAAHASLTAAYVVEAANRAVQLVFSFVPFQLGIQEGAAAATLRAFGYAASEGVSLAIIRKIRTVFWTALGLALTAGYALPQLTREEHRAL